MAEPDLDALRRRLAARGVTDVAPLAGGAASLTYRGTLDGRQVVVKVAPAGHEPIGHRDVLRQARMIAALHGTDVPVPEILWQDDGVPPLFGMSLVEGESLEPLFDEITGNPEPSVAQRYLSAVETMARLHRLDPAGIGFGDEPAADALAEIDRWCATLQTIDPELVPGWSETAGALRATLPTPVAPAVVHGDFRLGNILADGTEIAAVIDWEIWSVGDPRVDVGWFLINADPETYRRCTPYRDIVPTVGELATRYAEVVGADVADLRWFMALACFKSTATWALIVKHNRRRSVPIAEWEAMAPVLPRLLEQATGLLA